MKVRLDLHYEGGTCLHDYDGVPPQVGTHVYLNLGKDHDGYYRVTRSTLCFNRCLPPHNVVNQFFLVKCIWYKRD